MKKKMMMIFSFDNSNEAGTNDYQLIIKVKVMYIVCEFIKVPCIFLIMHIIDKNTCNMECIIAI